MNNTIKGCLIFVLFFTLRFTYAQSNALLWRISGEGLEKSSYLFGTIHIQDNRAFEFNDSVLVCLNNADAFAGELKVADLTSASLIEAMMAKEGEHLDDILSKKEYAKVESRFKEATGQSLMLFNGLKPFAVFVMMQQSTISKDAPEALDVYLSNVAEKNNKPLLAVEDIQTQIDVLNAFGKDELLAALDEYEDLGPVTEKMIVAYQKEDLDEIVALMNETSSKEYEEFEKKLLGERNVTMTATIASMVKEQSVFIAIGAGHLPGVNGVIELLRKEGFLVEPIKAPKSSKEVFPKIEPKIEKQNFEIVFPTSPQLETQKVATEIGELTLNMYSLELIEENNMLLFLGYSEYPEAIVSFLNTSPTSVDAMYLGAAKETFEALGITKFETGEIKFKGKDALKAWSDFEGGYFEVIYMYDRGTLYFIQVASKKGKEENKEKTKFLNSFVLKKE